MFYKYFGPILIALAATFATLATLAPDGAGPGVTCDELYHVFQGKQLVAALRLQGFSFLTTANIDRNFNWQPGGPPVQAPLGYWILGGTHYLFDPAPDDPSVISIAAARFAPAMAFALLILLVGIWTTQREGSMAGTVAAAAVALMPRLFGHAHLASLDMLTALFFTAAVLAAAEAARRDRLWAYALAGVVWGLAILVRLHGLLAVPPIVLWLVWRLRRKAVMPLLVWLVSGGATVLVGWPWLWLDPVGRFLQYVSSGTGRQALHTFYLGQVWADRDVPWHYPWVMMAVTVPVGFLILGGIGIWARCISPLSLWERIRMMVGRGEKRALQEDACRPHPRPLSRLRERGDIASHPRRFARLRERGDIASNALSPTITSLPDEGILLAAVMVFVLLVFSWPGTPVYDGVRLFLMVFPLWAIWTGIGARRLVELPFFLARPSWLRQATLAVLVAMQGAGLVMYWPCHLSYYNLLVGGLAGAERLGFEVTYWGDSIREPMLAEAVRRSPEMPILFAPNLAPFQAPAVTISSPSLREAGLSLVGLDFSSLQTAKKCRYAVVYHRRADLSSIECLLEQGRVVSEYEIQGVWLARLLELAPPLDVPAR